MINNITFETYVKTLPQEGFLAWEYNPLKNYRLNKDYYKYNNSIITKEEYNTLTADEQSKYTLLKAGSIVDFETDKLNFDLNHPVDILPQYSYDGSVNLILNDGYNTPKLINTRFSATEKLKYQIVDRKGNNDSNIYDEDQFDLDTSLYKKTIILPKLQFLGTEFGGSLAIGNYHFYFKFLDADGNSTDFIAESGLVSVFIGNTPQGIRSGFINENSNKLVKFYLSNIDTAYPYVEVYYTRSTSEIKQNLVTEAKRIDKKFIVNNSNSCTIIINGSEITQDIAVSDLNITYTLVENAQTQATCQNMLFLGNISTPEIPYKELQNLSLYICPELKTKEYINLDETYHGDIANTYYDSKFIYNYTGYWYDEYYRLGVVYIMDNNSLSPVFNIRGRLNINSDTTYDIGKTIKDLQIDEINHLIVGSETDNAVGVISFEDIGDNKIYGIGIKCSQLVKEELKKLGVVGMFFVRQKRIPITLCQALTISTDRENHTPVLKTKNGILKYTNNYNGSEKYVSERFIDDNEYLNEDFIQRLYLSDKANDNAAICPEYDLNEEYLNAFFSGDKLVIKEQKYQPINDYLTTKYNRHFYNTEFNNINPQIYELGVIGVPDSIPLAAIQDIDFSAKAGMAEDVKKFEFIDFENKKTGCTNILRGNFGSFIGLSEELPVNTIINIKTPQSSNDLEIRAQDKSAFYAISDRFALDSINNPILYRGDCYICQFTHRMNRNFNDPTAPYNDILVDKYTWKGKLKYDNETLDSEKLDKTNLGDVNAVQLGLWVTSTYRSSINMNIRGVNASYVSETSAIGHPRGFYPLYAMSTGGNYKVPEAQCYNKGFSISLSEKWNALVPDVPAIKNDFSNRIIYSDIHVNDAYKNGFRVFKSTNFRDYSKSYGSIIKLIAINDNLLCVFEHGIALIPVNERALAGYGEGGQVFINTSNVLPENPRIISDTYGSQWADSVIKTPSGIYGVDTVAKKIWKFNGDQITTISDLKVQEFLNNHITLGEREIIPVIGVRNVKTLYNAFKHDVMFTFYDNLRGFSEEVWNLCYNEPLDKFVTFYSWVPSYMESIDNIPFSFDRNTSKWISKLGISKSENNWSDGIVLSSVEIKDANWTAELSLNSNLNSKNLIFTLERDQFGNMELFEINGKSISLKDYDKLSKEEVIYLNIKCTVNDNDITIATIENVIALTTDITKYTTDFWKHGQAGLIDITDTILPTNWYGKQHPFEFECIVVNDPSVPKIFDNLEIISNKAEPESFHYEIIGESFDFAEDKPNMYYRQEATKALWQYNGGNINYNSNFIKVPLNQQPKSADFPRKYYYRQDTLNEIEDKYLSYTLSSKEQGVYDYKHLSGAELVYYPNRQEYRIWNHVPAINKDKQSQDTARSLIASNCQYLEDRWKVSINPILICYKNEYTQKISGKLIQNDNSTWDNGKPPLTIYNSEIPKDVLDTITESTLQVPNILNGIVIDNVSWLKNRKEIDLRDKFIKIRIRYSGKELAVIDFLNTIYRISYA